jgi:uncharacterized protein YbjT (DUF2867 family)
MIVITGATGNIGSRLAKRLFEAGEKIRIISRSEEKLAKLKKLGVETAVGDLLDAEFVKSTFNVCDKAFLVVQGNPNNGKHTEEELQMGENFAQALKSANISHAVFSSSLGTGKTGTPIIDCKVKIEETLKNSGVPITVLRPGNFFENMFAFLETLSSGFFTQPLDGKVKIPHVSADDIALVAQKAFDRGPKNWEVYDMPGAGDYCMRDIAVALSENLNRMIKYMKIFDDQFIEVFEGFGISKEFCDDILLMYRYFEKEDFTYDREAIIREFDHTPTTLEQFIPNLTKFIK